MKKLFAVFLCIFFAIQTAFPSFAELPMSFWENNNRLTEALEQGDADSAVYYCNLVVGAIETDSSPDLVMAATKLLQTAELLEKCGRYPDSAQFFSRYLPYAEAAGWADGVKIAKAKILQFRNYFTLYQRTDMPQVFYGAKYEPQSGVYYGVTSDSALADSLSTTSSVLFYQEYGDSYFDWLRVVLNNARERGQLVTLALNCPGQGAQIAQICQNTDYMDILLSFLAEYRDLKIILRFGAEMNIWDNRANPQEFVRAFRAVADKARAKCPNIAMMWSPYNVSSWDINMNDYYPGDEYVDWVGCSLYPQKYFTGRNDWPEDQKFNEIVFLSGDSADPVLALREVIDRYGDRKPIALSESGVSHYTRTLDEDCTNWAIAMLEKMYTQIPMVYPQVKLIHYFDRSLEYEVVDVALETNAALKQKYLDLIKLPHFIQRGQSAASTYYACSSLMQTENQMVYAYTHRFGSLTPNSVIEVDHFPVTAPTAQPYCYQLQLDGWNAGVHQMQFLLQGNVASEQSVTLQQPISLFLDGKVVESDVPPTIVSDRTLVPIRVISEQLGASVAWNGADRSITIKRGDTTLFLQIDLPVLYKNNTEIPLSVAPMILYDRTMVPLRAVSEAFNIEVEWVAETRSIFLKRN